MEANLSVAANAAKNYQPAILAWVANLAHIRAEEESDTPWQHDERFRNVFNRQRVLAKAATSGVGPNSLLSDSLKSANRSYVRRIHAAPHLV